MKLGTLLAYCLDTLMLVDYSVDCFFLLLVFISAFLFKSKFIGNLILFFMEMID